MAHISLIHILKLLFLNILLLTYTIRWGKGADEMEMIYAEYISYIAQCTIKYYKYYRHFSSEKFDLGRVRNMVHHLCLKP